MDASEGTMSYGFANRRGRRAYASDGLKDQHLPQRVCTSGARMQEVVQSPKYTFWIYLSRIWKLLAAVGHPVLENVRDTRAGDSTRAYPT
jgi:hypothetical protein